MKRQHLWIGLLLITGLTLSPSQQAAAQTARPEGAGESMLEQVMKRGVLRVGMSSFVPWAMQDKSGNFVGFEIDVANRVAQDMGVEAEFIPTKWSGIIPALLTGKFDIIRGKIINEKTKAMVLASFVGDSLTLGVHWIYDAARIGREFGRVESFLTPKFGDMP